MYKVGDRVKSNRDDGLCGVVRKRDEGWSNGNFYKLEFGHGDICWYTEDRLSKCVGCENCKTVIPDYTLTEWLDSLNLLS